MVILITTTAQAESTYLDTALKIVTPQLDRDCAPGSSGATAISLMHPNEALPFSVNPAGRTGKVVADDEHILVHVLSLLGTDRDEKGPNHSTQLSRTGQFSVLPAHSN